MKDQKKSNKRLRLFDLNRDGKGVGKAELENTSGLKRFFRSFKDNFTKILYVNIIMVLGNFPLMFLIATIPGYTKLDAFVPMHDLFQNLSAYFSLEPPTASGMTIYALEGIHNHILVSTPLTYVFYGISALSLLTFGLVNVGTAYILRNIAMGEPVFVLTDFKYAVKRNWRQALPFGVIDLLINAILIFNIYSMFMSGTSDFISGLLLWANIVIFVLYFFMRYYIYVQMVTFDLKVFKILKNSLIFSLLGLKRNLMALLGIILGLVLEMICLFGAGGILIPFAVGLPLLILIAMFSYMKVYASYFKIKEIMIDPYNREHGITEKEVDEEEVIMRDDVTEKQRLEEIKKKNGLI